MNLIRFAVNRPISTCMLMILFFMGGVFAISAMEVELLPSISIPTLVVFTENAKASPEEIHKDITLPLEEALNSTSGLVSMNSVSFEGESRIILELDWGVDVDFAEVEVRERINTVKMPEDARKPLIWKYDPSATPVFRFDIFGKSGSNLSTEDLKQLADDVIKPRIERISGVGEVAILGGVEPEYRIMGRPEAPARNNLTVLATVRCVEDEAQNRKGGTIRIRDVATVVRDKKKEETFARYNGQPSVGISIKKTSDASVVTVIEAIKEELGRLAGRQEMEAIEMQVSQDDSEYVINAQDLVLGSIVQGVLLAAALLILFLRDMRTTVVVGLATPISIVAAFMCLKGLGCSRNVLPLGGMGLAAGMTLDSSIVLLDSIMKQIELGKNPKDAAINGASEVTLGIFSSNMTTVAVFMPILFIPGLMREIFKDLSYSIIFAVLFAMVIGVLFIPMVSARIFVARKMGEPSATSGGIKRIVLFPWNLMCRMMERFDRVSEGILGAVLAFFLRSLPLKIVTVVVLVAASVASIAYVPGRAFLPQGQVNELWIRYEAPVGSTLDYVNGRVRKIEAMLKEAAYGEFVEYAAANVSDDEGRLFVKLRPNKPIQMRDAQGRKVFRGDGIPEWQVQRPPAWHSLAKCVQRIREGCDAIEGLKGNVFVTVVDKVRGGDQAPITLKVYRRQATREGSEGAELSRLQDYVREKLVPAISGIRSAYYQRVKVNETPTEIVIDTDAKRQRLNEIGLSTRGVSDTVRASIYGVEAVTVQEKDREVDVTVILGEEGGAPERYPVFGVRSVEPLRVRSMATGQLYQIRDVAAVSETPKAGSMVLERTNRKPTATLESNHRPYEITGETVGDVSAQIEAALRGVPGFSEGYLYDLKNTAKDTEDSFADAAKAFIISIVLVYMIMCAQFERLGDPLAIMITVPLAAMGSVIMLHLTGEVTSLGALVGAVILCGVVVNNGIILVEYVNILRARGVSRDEAIIQGSVRKLRSILITSLTSILGMVPLVLGVGEGTELYRGVAAVIVGGLLVSTPLTLIGLPLLYALIDEGAQVVSALGFRLSILTARKR